MIYKDIHIFSWNEWVEFCKHYNEDPHEISELGFDKGEGDSQTVHYKGEHPKRIVISEDGWNYLYCPLCGKTWENEDI